MMLTNNKNLIRKIDVMENIDSVPSNVQSSRQEASLYVFEDNEAVIKMIIKGTNPTMRHVSRTHRVALDWLFDRINLDSKIQIKYIDNKNQLADILTKGSFTRDEWNHLLCLFNISHFSSINNFETIGLRISGRRAAGIFTEFTEEHKSLGINSMSTTHKSYAASCKHPRKQRSAAQKNSSQRSSSAQPVRFNLLIDLRRRLKDRGDVPAETRENWPRISQSSKKRTKVPFSHLPTNGVSQRHP